MQEADVALLMRESFVVVLKLGGPPLLAALAAGLIVSLLQAITQISEQTLAFVPKVAAVAGALLLLGGFMLATLTDFARLIFDRLITVGAG
jgi:flagellar biosynthetic protein FliQ